MTVSIVDGATRTAFAAAVFQQTQCEAVIAPWAGGNVTARVLGTGGVLRQTVTLGPWTIAPTTPREVRHGARLAYTTVSTGDIQLIEYRTPGGPLIFTATAGEGATAAAVDFAGPIRNLCGITLSGAVFTGNPALPVAPAPLAATQVVAAPQFWTQFSRPQVVRSGDFVYLGHTDMDGDTIISQYNVATGVSSSFTLATGGGPNGHDSCVISVRPDGRIMAVWSVQNTECLRRISTNPHNISAWGPALKLSGINPISYASCWYLSTPNRHYVHARDGEGGGPGDRFCVAWSSTNNGDTFSTGEQWITQAGERPYVISVGNGVNRIDFLLTNKHQTDSGPDSFFNIYHCYAIFAADGSKQFFTTGGTLIGSSVTRISDQCTLIHTGATGGPAWPWDIALGTDGHPRVLYVRQQTADDHRHMFSRWNGSAWVPTEIGASGARLYSSEIWSDGALSFDGLGVDCVLRSVQVGSAWEIQDWRTTDNGATWSKFADITSGSAAGQKAVTPLKVTNADFRVSRAWKFGPINNWNDFNMALWLMGRN